MPFLEPVATQDWFETQPRFGLNWQGVGEVFGWPSVGYHSESPTNVRVTELVYFALQLAGLLYAWRRDGGVRVWLGMALIGAQMEFLGVAVTHSHKQSQMMVQILPFLPLKEVLWYPMTQYPCFVLASGLQLGTMGTAAATALLQSFQVVQYESMAYRTGVDFLVSNPNFPLANTQDLIGGGPWMNIYGNFAITFMAVVLAKTFPGNELLAMAGLGLTAVSVLGFYPLNLLKLAGCLASSGRCSPLWPEMNGWELDRFVDLYIRIVKQSPVLENLVVKLLMLWSTWFVLVNTRTARMRISKQDVGFGIGNIVAYHLVLGWNVYLFDQGKQASAEEALSIWARLLN
ncbi:hypothetical protein BASA81_006392 [Batrachochytrium salamandrivorans]|nr:hypothetical protein BASA81_006392 [Batrachochytrium salamandrivorans]